MFFEFNSYGTTRGHSLKLMKKRESTNLRHHFFSERVINNWNSLDNKTMTSGSINIFKGNLERLTVKRDRSVCWQLMLLDLLVTGHPPYLTELIQYNKPSRSTRSSASHLLSVPRHNLSFGARAFRVAEPKIWNSIPLHIRQSQTYSSFRRHLKTHYFISAHLAP